MQTEKEERSRRKQIHRQTDRQKERDVYTLARYG